VKRMIKFTGIGAFRNVIKAVCHRSAYIGMDDQGEPIYDGTRPKPTITFNGAVKLHGTNAGVSYEHATGEFWAQSRKNTITPEKDNAGFSFFVESHKDVFLEMFKSLPCDGITTIYGEWCGKGVQSTVAITELDKFFVIIGVKESPLEPSEDEVAIWLPDDKTQPLSSNDDRVFNILDFPTFSIDIDFKNPELSTNRMVEITAAVEAECPVAKQLGVSGIGEGVVWKSDVNGERYIFKVKGDEHAGKSKVKTLKPVDNERLQRINDIAEQVTPVWRLEQAIQETFDTNNGGDIDRKGLGDFLRWVVKDVLKEEIDVISDAGFEPKDVNKKISEVCRTWFFERESQV